MVLRIFIVLIWMILANSARAQDVDIFEQADKHFASIASALETCNPDTATNISFDDAFNSGQEFKANPKYDLQCVSFNAIASWRRLFKDEYSGYLIAKSGQYRADKTVQQHIGLAGHDIMTEAGLYETAQKGRVTGVLGTCGFTMGGYCHYDEGPYLTLAHLEGVPIKTRLRLTGDDAKKRYGNLETISAVKALDIGLADFFSKWRNAIGLRDKKSYQWIATIAGYENNEYARYEEHQKILSKTDIEFSYYTGLWEAFFDLDSPYRKLSQGRLGEMKYFEILNPAKEKDEPKSYLACLCLVDDCNQRWPISTRDVYVSHDLPYLCEIGWKEEGHWKANLPSASSILPVREKSNID